MKISATYLFVTFLMVVSVNLFSLEEEDVLSSHGFISKSMITKEFTLERDNGHNIHVSTTVVSAHNKPLTNVIIFHGGWGPLPHDANFLKGIENLRIIEFHQRGTGKSTPNGRVIANGVGDIIGDVEAIRLKLGIDKWIVVGGSTGAMLALAYAAFNPDSVQGLLLRGTWLLRKHEIDFDYNNPYGKASFYPSYWRQLIRDIGIKKAPAVNPSANIDVVKAGYAAVFGNDKAVSEKAATAWLKWDALGCSFEDLPAEVTSNSKFDPVYAVSIMRVALHYYTHSKNDLTYNGDALVDAASASLKEHPIYLVTGRNDMLCPPAWALELSTALKNSHLRIVEHAAHSAMGVNDQMKAAVEAMIKQQ